LLVTCIIRDNIKEKLEQKFITFQYKKTGSEAASFFVLIDPLKAYPKNVVFFHKKPFIQTRQKTRKEKGYVKT